MLNWEVSFPAFEERDGSTTKVIGDNIINLRPWSLFPDDPISECIRLKFKSANDYEYFKDLLSTMCLITRPQVHNDYLFLKELGKGSQGTVELCKKKEKIRSSLSNNNTRRNEEDLFAIKKYSEHVHRESYFKYKPSLRFD